VAVNYNIISLAANSSLKALRGTDLSRRSARPPAPVGARAGYNFRYPLISPLSVDPLVNGTTLTLHFENINLTEERLFLSLLNASTLKIRFCRIF
jgi:hypothetical protein